MKNIQLSFKPSNKLITRAQHAISSSERMVGLLKHHSLSDDQAMLIGECKQVHTFFMKFAIDAIFINKHGVVVGVQELKPWRLSKIFFRAASVIETSLGWAKRNGIKVGSSVEVTSC